MASTLLSASPGGSFLNSGSGAGGRPFMTPWLDYSTVTLPDNHELVMWWAQYMWLTDGNFRTAMERVAAHFMTVLEFPDLEPDEESMWKDLFLHDMNYRRELLSCAHDYLCFHGDTKVITSGGVFALRDLAGTSADVLTETGEFKPAEFKHFGRQKLLEVQFSDGSVVRATPEHQWLVTKSTGGTLRLPTTAILGRHVPQVAASRPKLTPGFHEAVRHGFTFGTQPHSNERLDGAPTAATFRDGGASEVLDFFHGTGQMMYYPEYRAYRITGFPAYYSAPPANEAPADYWYGFVCGLIAARAEFHRTGRLTLTHTSESVLQRIREQLPRFGMLARPVVQDHVRSQRAGHPIFRLVFYRSHLMECDLLLRDHIAILRQNQKRKAQCGALRVVDIRDTGLEDDVYCGVEHATHTLVLAGGILTGNCYGNSFVSIYLPFRRFCRCQKCFLEQPIERVEYRLSMMSTAPYLRWGRVSECPRCGNTDEYEVFDRKDNDLSRIRLNRYDPSDIELAQNRYSLRKKFYWRIPDEDRRDIQGRARIHIDDTPIEVLEAVAVSGKLAFDDDMMLHQDEPTVSGVRTRGWGIPRSIANFRTAWLQQLTNKMDQAIAIDYTMGIRLLSPTPTAGGEDPMGSHGMEEFVQRIGGIIQHHRNNPASYHTAPYPVQYQFLGGEGATLLPPDKLKFRHQEYLNQLGVPLEYHQMTLQVQAAPMALRLFEAYWQAIPSFYNRILDWMVKILSRVYGLDPTKVVMQKTTIADDMERKAVLLQLMSANQLSPQTALQPFGIDAHEEVKRTMRHQDYVARVQREFEEKEMQREEMGALRSMTSQTTPMQLQEQQMMAQQQQAGAGQLDPMAAGAVAAMGMGGIPMGGMPGPTSQTPRSLSQMSEQAAMIAQQLYPMDESSRRRELRNLREGNKDLHALVIQNLAEIRSQARSQGEQVVRSQAAGGM